MDQLVRRDGQLWSKLFAIALCAVEGLLIASGARPGPTFDAALPALQTVSAANGPPRAFIAFAGFDPRIFYWKVLEGAARAEARRRGVFFVSLSSADKTAETQLASLGRALNAGVKGLIVGVAPTGMDRVYAEANKRNVPVVVVNESADDPTVDAEVYARDVPGAGAAVTHFLGQANRPQARPS
ncbi:MAG: hypothetical protein KC502_17365 [Myxococcales bacterium]|nr:hypothetical protein [Myxococcales bacterium]